MSKSLAMAVALVLAGAIPASAQNQSLRPDQAEFRALYKELINSSGGATPIVPFLYQHAEWLVIPTIITLIVEVGAPLALLDRRLGWLWSFGIWAMHKGIAVVMGIIFPFPISGLAYVCFFPVDVWVAKIVGVARTRVPGRRAAA